MTNLDELTLSESIKNIDNVIIDSEIAVESAMIDVYGKMSMIMENYEGNDINQFSIIQEADETGATQILTKDIKFDNFDNSNIIKAIKYFNEARKAQSPDIPGPKVDMTKIVHSNEWKDGISCIEKQFDCKIHLSHFMGVLLGTSTFQPIYTKKNVVISKTKGFQLNGINMLINVGSDMTSYIPNDSALFGQFMVSVLLHEIFHNISSMFVITGGQFGAITQTAFDAASSVKSGKTRRMLMENYVNTIENLFKIKFESKRKKKLVKQLSFLSTIRFNKKAVDDFAKNMTSFDSEMSEEDIKAYIKHLKSVKIQSKVIHTMSRAYVISQLVSNLIVFALGISIGNKKSPKNIILNLSLIAINIGVLSKMYKRDTGISYEEYYCDLFASMYKLPPIFKYAFDKSNKTKQAVPDTMSKEDLQTIHELKQAITIASKDVHPTENERNYASLKVARNLLANGESLDPSVKKYLEWIVNNFSNLDNLDIENKYNSRLFDPKEADDLDNHLQLIIDTSNATLTEYDMSWLFEDYTAINE